MRKPLTRQLLLLLAGVFAVAPLGAAPASADVTCADLRTRPAAQSYLEGPAADAARLDSDGDGRACEANTPVSDGRWTLLGLGALIAAVVLGARLPRGPRTPTTTPARAPGPVVAAVETERLLAQAPTGSLDVLARALRRLPSSRRMPLLEDHARAHGSTPQGVLDALVAEVADLALQRWALAGYGPPAHVRTRFCPCVGAARNFGLTTVDGVHIWTCASCHSPAVPRVDPVVSGDQSVEQ